MSDDKLGYRECYICKSAIPPLVSICWSCGYSQLPNPQAGGEAPAGQDSLPASTPARDTLRSDIQARLDQARADLKSRLNKK